MLIKKFAFFVLVASFSACGTSNNETNKAATQMPAPESAVVAAPAIPNFFVIKVPVDANGNEISENAEMKTFDQNAFSAEVSTAKAFEQGTSVSVSDELDQDSSTSQWYYRGYRRGYYGRGYGYNYPNYSYYGNYYNYGYYNNYSYNSCNYYVYSSPYYYY